MPEVGRLVVEYQCPECGRKVTQTLSYILGDTKGSVKLESAWWCHFQYCDARHRLKYRVEDKPSGLKLKVIEFTSEDVIYKKRFRVISGKE